MILIINGVLAKADFATRTTFNLSVAVVGGDGLSLEYIK